MKTLQTTSTKNLQKKRAWRAIKNFTVIAFGVGILSACATAEGPQFSGVVKPVADKGDVYLYRTEAFTAGGDAFTVRLDNEKIGELANGSFIHLRLEPGKHVLRVKPSGLLTVGAEAELDLQAGKTLFYRYEFPTGILTNLLFVGAGVVLKDEATAVAEMATLKAMK
ncbi:MAG: DUF2846 domain-containing protein [Burkholderiaceae bacterium]|nr:DUF2846 domain-containing protein [Burkholderiaceae bacterium]